MCECLDSVDRREIVCVRRISCLSKRKGGRKG